MRWATAVSFFGALAAVLCTEVSDEADTEPVLHVLARPSTFNAGERRAIFCQGKNLPHTINWYSPSGSIVGERSNANNRVYVERKIDNGMMMVPLIIHEVKVEDDGAWTCKAGEYNETINIVVGIKVKFHNRRTNMESDEGKNAKLVCEAKGHPTPVIQWYKNGKFISVETAPGKYAVRNKGDTYILEVRSLTYEDVGEYVCKVTQKALSYYTDKTILLSVKHAPVLGTYKTVEAYAAINTTKNITCSATAYPLPAYQWFRRVKNFDREIPEDENTIFTAEDSSSSTLMLRIYSEEDLGEYKCKVSNNKGSQSVIFDVSLGERPNPPDSVSLVAANATHLTFNVTCAACPLWQNDTTSPDPKNLTVTGFDFQLTKDVEGYPPDWESAYMFEMEIEEPHMTLFEVGVLPNTTSFHGRVRTRNLAGESDWLDIEGDIATTSYGVSFIANIAVIVIAALVAVRY